MRLDPVPLAPAPPPDVQRPADIGVRVFDEINATMAELTGVSPQDPAVAATYATVKQSLPTIETHRHVRVGAPGGRRAARDPVLQRAGRGPGGARAVLPGLQLRRGAGHGVRYAAGRAIVLDPLVGRMLRTNVATEPDAAGVRSDLDNLITRLASCGGSCAADRTETVVKASCAALLGSAATLLQ